MTPTPETEGQMTTTTENNAPFGTKPDGSPYASAAAAKRAATLAEARANGGAAARPARKAVSKHRGIFARVASNAKAALAEADEQIATRERELTELQAEREKLARVVETMAA